MPGWFDIPSLENLEEVSDKNSELITNAKWERDNILLSFCSKVALEVTIYVCPLQSSFLTLASGSLSANSYFSWRYQDFFSQDEHDMEGMARSAETVYKLIKGEMRSGIPSERIMVGGFSQGQNQGKSMPPDYDALP